MSKTILVVGASGNHGPIVARQLSGDGFDVRVLTRRREKAAEKFGDRFPIFQGDVTDPDSLRPALAGCWGVHINLRGWLKSHDRVEHRGTANVVRAAREAGVERLTYLSCLHARPEYTHLPSLKAKVDAEAVVRAGGIPYAIFAPSLFMENMYHLQPGKHLFISVAPRRHAFHYLAAADYAQRVSQVYQLPQAPNCRFELYGPEPITQPDAVLRYCALMRPETRIHFIPLWVTDLYNRLIHHKNRQYGVRVMRFYKRVGEPGDPETAERSLGRPGTTYQSWCEAQQAIPAV